MRKLWVITRNPILLIRSSASNVDCNHLHSIYMALLHLQSLPRARSCGGRWPRRRNRPCEDAASAPARPACHDASLGSGRAAGAEAAGASNGPRLSALANSLSYLEFCPVLQVFKGATIEFDLNEAGLSIDATVENSYKKSE